MAYNIKGNPPTLELTTRCPLCDANIQNSTWISEYGTYPLEYLKGRVCNLANQPDVIQRRRAILGFDASCPLATVHADPNSAFENPTLNLFLNPFPEPGQPMLSKLPWPNQDPFDYIPISRFILTDQGVFLENSKVCTLDYWDSLTAI